jgi:hypothetical protein
MISHFVCTSALALVCAASAATAATARTPYDGAWTVLIVTQRGTCDRSYRYGVQIVDGIVTYNGGMVNFSGRVTANGAVRVTVSAGSSRADGSGKLTRSTGQGNWHGRSGNDACFGYWTAQRH